MTVSLQVGVETLTWSQFAWENGYEPATRIDGAPKTFVFDRQQHAAMLGDAYDRTAGLPYELAVYLERMQPRWLVRSIGGLLGRRFERGERR